jgi:hypothetical protein
MDDVKAYTASDRDIAEVKGDEEREAKVRLGEEHQDIPEDEPK